MWPVSYKKYIDARLVYVMKARFFCCRATVVAAAQPVAQYCVMWWVGYYVHVDVRLRERADACFFCCLVTATYPT